MKAIDGKKCWSTKERSHQRVLFLETIKRDKFLCLHTLALSKVGY